MNVISDAIMAQEKNNGSTSQNGLLRPKMAGVDNYSCRLLSVLLRSAHRLVQLRSRGLHEYDINSLELTLVMLL